jgi:hypothetical protein
MIEAKATLLSWEKRPNEDFRGIFAHYPRLSKDPDQQRHEIPSRQL